jgi:glycosyltransferase involved in cell wall biosynthesis
MSVIIPTHNRKSLLLRTLDSVARQSPPGDLLEVVVVVDGSSDGTTEALQSLQEMPFRLRVVQQKHAGQAVARNRGAATAGGEFLVFVDDDMKLQSGFLRLIESELGSGADVVLARVQTGPWVPDTMLSREARAWDVEEHAALTSGRRRFDDVLFAATGIRRACFEAHQGFDEVFTADGSYGNEDLELGYRLLEAGAEVRYCAAALAYTDVDHDHRRALRRAYQLGGNDVRLVRLHPELADERFGRKFRHSTIHRAIASTIRYLPGAALVLTPLRWAAVAAVSLGGKGWVSYRLWFAATASCYWNGVADAAGWALVGPIPNVGRRGNDGGTA